MSDFIPCCPSLGVIKFSCTWHLILSHLQEIYYNGLVCLPTAGLPTSHTVPILNTFKCLRVINMFIWGKSWWYSFMSMIQHVHSLFLCYTEQDKLSTRVGIFGLICALTRVNSPAQIFLPRLLKWSWTFPFWPRTSHSPQQSRIDSNQSGTNTL